MNESGLFDESFPDANVRAVQSLAGALVTTLGPVPRDKLIVTRDEDEADIGHLPGVQTTGEYVVTSDGTTILETLDIDHPIAPVVRRLAGPERPGETDVEGQDIPDGVTSTVVLSAALLDEALALIDRGVHPRTIKQGYHAALATATDCLADLSQPADGHLVDVARTAMTGNDVGGRGRAWAQLAVEAAQQVGSPTPSTFAVRALRRGSVADSRLVAGTVLDRNEITDDRMPRRVNDATVLVLDGQDEGGLRTLEFDGRYEAEVTDPASLRGLQDVGADRRERIVEQLLAHGVDVVVAKQGVEKSYARELAAHGIVSIDGVTRLYLNQVCKATGATPVKHTEDFDAAALGQAGVVHEIRGDPRGSDRSERRLVVFDECADPDAVCVLLQGVWGPLADAATTELRKAVAAVALATGERGDRPGVLPGGGAAEMQVARAVREQATSAAGREQLVVEAFADAVETVVHSLAKNGGLDPLSVRPDLRAANRDADAAQGISLPEGTVVDATATGIVDPLATRLDCYVAATEVASLLVGIDDAIPANPPEEAPDPDDAIYEDAAEQQQSYLSKHDDTRWDR